MTLKVFFNDPQSVEVVAYGTIAKSDNNTPDIEETIRQLTLDDSNTESVQNGSNDKMKIYLNGKAVSESEIKELRPTGIAQVIVNKKNAVVQIYTKSAVKTKQLPKSQEPTLK